jgi:membrane-associated protease RseP (regulator of RpoE activity)
MRRWFQIAAVVGTVAVVNCAGVAHSRGQETPPAAQNVPDSGQVANPDSPRANLADEQPERVREETPGAERAQAAEDQNRNERQSAEAGVDIANRQSGFGANFRGNVDGLIVDRIDQNSIAARAGLRAQDRIISIDGRTFRSSQDLDQYLRSARGRLPIVFQRGGRQYTVDATMNELGSQRSNAWLGVHLSQSREGAAGARIQQVFPAGPAARAGLWAGDVIVAADGQPIRSADELIAFVDTKQPREEAKFTVQREGREVQIAARLGGGDDFVMSPVGNEEYGGRGEYDRRQYASTEDGVDFSSIPEYAMQLEQHRRQAEQIQRLEVLICELRDDVRELRNVMAGNPSDPSVRQQPGESEQQGSTTPSPPEPQSPQTPQSAGQPENSPSP